MKTKIYLAFGLALLLASNFKTFGQANKSLSNLTSTAVNQSLVPASDSMYSLGSKTLNWNSLYVSSGIYLGKTLALYSPSGFNFFVGRNAGNSTLTGMYNTASGTQTLQALTSGSYNTASGYQALYSNATGYNNTANGAKALNANTTGYTNTAIGFQTMYTNTTGYYNTAIGYNALYFNTSGNHNSALGIGALYDNTTGYGNVGVGEDAIESNSTGIYNTGVGVDALYHNTTGSFNTASGFYSLYSNTANNNTANGYYSLYSNTTGYSNVAMGIGALYSNTAAHNLVAIGDSALYHNNTTGTSFSTAIGSKALFSNTTGESNTATGYQALYANTTGSSNIAIGDFTLNNNTTGNGNIAIGSSNLTKNTTGGGNISIGELALSQNITGGANSAFGESALSGNTTGTYNTAVGLDVLDNNNTGTENTGIGALSSLGDNYSNATVVGFEAYGTASNQVRLGNSSVTSIGGYANFTNISDGRVKKNIKQNVPGLAFISKLLPITYNLDLDAADKITQAPQRKDATGKIIQPSTDEIAARQTKEKITYTGFIAQDVEKAAKSLNYDFSGVDAAKNEKDLYGLRYAEFVVPLVKAVQELSVQNDSLKNANTQQQQININLQQQLNDIKAMVISMQQCSPCSQTSQALATQNYAVIADGASLEQNIPNPFGSTTNIKYTLPQKYSNAYIIVTDNNGRTLKQINVSGSGKSSVTLDASILSAGAYKYSLLVDNKLIDTKQMVLAK